MRQRPEALFALALTVLHLYLALLMVSSFWFLTPRTHPQLELHIRLWSKDSPCRGQRGALSFSALESRPLRFLVTAPFDLWLRYFSILYFLPRPCSLLWIEL